MAALVLGPICSPAAHAHSPALGAFPAKVFAPYVYVQERPTFPLVKASNATGGTHFTLAFINDRGGCEAGWDSDIALTDGFYHDAIGRIRSNGGDVIVSFGGAGATELARSCGSAAKLRAQYQAVVNEYHLTRLDFDIEGNATLADTAATTRRNRAIAAMQRVAHDAGRMLTVQFTLGVGLDGLPQRQRQLLRDAHDNGVRVKTVNIMVMDYGGGADGDQMAQNARNAAAATFRQLHAIYPAKTAAQRWAMIGLTPMIGENDVPGEVFTLDDAHALLDFATARGIGLIGFWSASRDKQCFTRAPSDQCSGVEQERYDFAKVFVDLEP